MRRARATSRRRRRRRRSRLSDARSVADARRVRAPHSISNLESVPVAELLTHPPHHHHLPEPPSPPLQRDLGFNAVAGSIPSELGSLTGLTSLYAARLRILASTLPFPRLYCSLSLLPSHLHISRTARRCGCGRVPARAPLLQSARPARARACSTRADRTRARRPSPHGLAVRAPLGDSLACRCLSPTHLVPAVEFGSTRGAKFMKMRKTKAGCSAS